MRRGRWMPMRKGRIGLGLAAGAMAAVLGGCLGWTEYRAGDPTLGEYLVQQPTLDGLMADALGWTIERFPPGTPAVAAAVGEVSLVESDAEVAVSVPSTISRARYDAIALRASPSAFPLSPLSRHLPLYRVGTIKVRASGAQIDIHRPLPGPADAPRSYQALTLHMRTSFGGWKVERFDAWSPGVIPLPPAEMMTLAETEPQSEAPQPEEPGAEQPGA